MSKVYLVTDNESMLFLVTEKMDYFVARRKGFNSKWNAVDVGYTPFPSKSDKEVSEQEALQIAMNFGMSEEDFYNV